MKKNGNIIIVGGTEKHRESIKSVLNELYNITLVKDIDDSEAIKKISMADVVMISATKGRAINYESIRSYYANPEVKDIPLIAFASKDYIDIEAECARLGVMHYLSLPSDPDIIKIRVKSAFDMSELIRLRSIKDSKVMDELTGVYKKEFFLNETKRIISGNEDIKFAVIQFDIYKFHMFNSLYGKEEGDRFIRYMGDLLKGLSKRYSPMTYCHEDADIFYACLPYENEENMIDFFERIRTELNLYRKDYDFLPNFGVYIVEDRALTVQEMLGLARFASKRCKGRYRMNYAFYTDEMTYNIEKEQFVLNNMKTALDNEHFVIYFQPKYELLSNKIQGAEALVRWDDPKKGLIPPMDFVPIFEKNGFITELDFYVWEHTCMTIRKWLDEGHTPCPISVNVSRVSLFNPMIAAKIYSLIEKYKIPAELLQLELTESAYTDNPGLIKDTIKKLHSMGFTILMDDFGSGYSSLNALKDIEVDVLKIDMKFMEKADIPGRSENILASVVRMAKWLNMQVIAEGVETEEQVKFLRSIGCEFVQGFYFARPMPVQDYEIRAFNEVIFSKKEDRVEENDQFWVSNAQIETLFSNMLQPVAIFEYDGKYDIELIRTNDAFYDLFGFTTFATYNTRSIENIDKNYRKDILDAFTKIVKTKGTAECEYVSKLSKGNRIWINMKMKYLSSVANKYIIFATLTDVTVSKELDRELQMYKRAVVSGKKERQNILIIDDMKLNRKVLKEIFEEEYDIFEANDGKEGLELIEKKQYDIDMILLDLAMPVMSGEEFLEKKLLNEKMVGIPVIIISSNDSVQMQVDTLACGVYDYITKPYVSEVVVRRVKNVLDANKRIIDALRTNI